TVEAASAAGAVESFSASASDDVDPTPSLDCAPGSGATFPLGDTTVTCTATDASGNHGSAGFVVRVVDTTPPSLATPTDFAADAPPQNAGALPSPASASVLVAPPPVVTCLPASGSGFFAIGDTSVLCTATDAAANQSAAGFVVHVRGAVEQTS